MTARTDTDAAEGGLDALLSDPVDLAALLDQGDPPDIAPLPEGCDLSELEALLDWDNLPDLGPLPDLDLPDS